MAARLAAHAPRFGVADPLLQRDLGFYVGQLPWLERMHGLFLRASVTGTILVALLYLGMGSLRFRRWLPQASAHAGATSACCSPPRRWRWRGARYSIRRKPWRGCTARSTAPRSRCASRPPPW